MATYTILYKDSGGSLGTQYPLGSETAVVRLLAVLIRKEGFESFSVTVEEEK